MVDGDGMVVEVRDTNGFLFAVDMASATIGVLLLLLLLLFEESSLMVSATRISNALAIEGIAIPKKGILRLTRRRFIVSISIFFSQYLGFFR
jgi:hypothetical protein